MHTVRCRSNSPRASRDTFAKKPLTCREIAPQPTNLHHEGLECNFYKHRDPLRKNGRTAPLFPSLSYATAEIAAAADAAFPRSSPPRLDLQPPQASPPSHPLPRRALPAGTSEGRRIRRRRYGVRNVQMLTADDSGNQTAPTPPSAGSPPPRAFRSLIHALRNAPMRCRRRSHGRGRHC